MVESIDNPGRDHHRRHSHQGTYQPCGSQVVMFRLTRSTLPIGCSFHHQGTNEEEEWHQDKADIENWHTPKTICKSKPCYQEMQCEQGKGLGCHGHKPEDQGRKYCCTWFADTLVHTYEADARCQSQTERICYKLYWTKQVGSEYRQCWQKQLLEPCE